MVYLECSQRDPRADVPSGIARVVADPSVVDDLIEQLSAVQGAPRDLGCERFRVGRDEASVGR